MPIDTIVDLSKHLLVTSIIAVCLWWKYHDLRLVMISYLTGILIDVDHFFDFFYYSLTAVQGKLNLMDFFNPDVYVKATSKVFVLFHGWEYLLILGLFARKFFKRIPGIFWALILPYFCHLIIDQSPFVRAPLAYFFINRLIHNFSLTAFNGY